MNDLPKTVRKKLKQQGGIAIENLAQENPFDALRPDSSVRKGPEPSTHQRPAPQMRAADNSDWPALNPVSSAAAPAYAPSVVQPARTRAPTAEETVIDIVSRQGHEEFLIKFFIAKLRDLGMEPQPTREYMGLLSDAIRSNPRPAVAHTASAPAAAVPMPRPAVPVAALGAPAPTLTQPAAYPVHVVHPVMPQYVFTANGPIPMASFPVQLFPGVPNVAAARSPLPSASAPGSLLAQAQLRQQQVRAQGGPMSAAAAPAAVLPAAAVALPAVAQQQQQQQQARDLEEDFLSRFGDVASSASSSAPAAVPPPAPLAASLAAAAATPMPTPPLLGGIATTTSSAFIAAPPKAGPNGMLVPVVSAQGRRPSGTSLASSIASTESSASGWTEEDWDDEKAVLRRKQEESMKALQSSFLSNFSLDDFEDDDTLCTLCCMRPQNARILDCSHDEFCFECMEVWFRKERTCPKCRAPVRSVEKTDKKRKHKPKVKKKKPTVVHRSDTKAAFRVQEPDLDDTRGSVTTDSDGDEPQPEVRQVASTEAEASVDPEEIKRIQAQEEQLRQQRALEKQQRKKQLKQAEEEKKRYKQMMKEQFKPKPQPGAEPPAASKKLTVGPGKKEKETAVASASAVSASTPPPSTPSPAPGPAAADISVVVHSAAPLALNDSDPLTSALPSNMLVVGPLGPSEHFYTDAELQKKFENYGEIAGTRIIYSLGFFVVVYARQELAVAAQRLESYEMQKIRKSIKFAKPELQYTNQWKSAGPVRFLFVAPLSPTVSDGDLRHMFAAYGPSATVRQINTIEDEDGQPLKGAIVQFDTLEETALCKQEMQGRKYLGLPMKIFFCNSDLVSSSAYFNAFFPHGV